MKRLPLTDDQRKMVENNMALAKFIVVEIYKKYYIPEVPFDDALQIAYETLCKAARLYDANKATLSGYLNSGIYRNIIKEKRRSSIIRGPINGLVNEDQVPTVLSYDHTFQIAKDEDATTCLLDKLQGASDVDSAVDAKNAIEALPTRERDVVLRIINGATKTEIARSMGVSRERVLQLTRRASTKIQQATEEADAKFTLCARMRQWRRDNSVTVASASSWVYCNDEDWKAWEAGWPITEWWRKRVMGLISSPLKKKA